MIYDYEREGANMRDNFGTMSDSAQAADTEQSDREYIAERQRWDTDGGMCGCNERTPPLRRNMHTHASLFDVAVTPAPVTLLDCDSKELRARMIEMRAELGSVGRALFTLQSEIAALRADVRRSKDCK